MNPFFNNNNPKGYASLNSSSAHNLSGRASTSLSPVNDPQQMTQFPAVDVEEGVQEGGAWNAAPNARNSTSNSAATIAGTGGLINSFLGNFFRNSSSSSATISTSAAMNGPLKKLSGQNSIDKSNACPSHLNHHQRSQNQHNHPVPSSSDQPSNSAQSSSSSSPSPRHHPIPHQKNMSLISNMFKGLNEEPTKPSNVDNSLKDYQKSEFRRYWMPDSTGKECYECYEKFNAFRRRHHCRLCGQIFCGKCSNRQVNGTELGYSGVLRLCTFCADQVEDYILERACSKSVHPNLSVDFLDNNLGTLENGLMASPSDRPLSEKAHFLPPGPEYFLSRARGELTIDASESSPFPIGRYTPHGSQDSHTSSQRESHYLEKQFEEKIELLLDGLLKREHLDVEIWKPLLLCLTKKVIRTVLPKMLKMPEALNVLEFIHIKKLAIKENGRKMPSYEVGILQCCRLFSGFDCLCGALIVRGVSFTKSLAHSSMPSTIQNVSLMLLTGCISYERVLEKLSSLEPIMLQEHEYLKIQVDRISSRKVSLLLVENSVASAASEMLLKEGIALVTNIKHKVLERVALATNSDIITSLDTQFLQPRIGFVPHFSQRQFTKLDGNKKKILVLDNCLGNFGATILLYGSSQKELIAAKRVLKFLFLSRYSSELEMSFLAMFNSSSLLNIKKKKVSSNSIQQTMVTEDRKVEESFECKLCQYNLESEEKDDENSSEFVQLFRQTQLTNSPAIQFAPPYLETQAGRSCFLLPYLKTSLFRFLQPHDLQVFKETEEVWERALDRITDSHKQAKMDNHRKNKHKMLVDELVDPKKVLDEGRWASFRGTSSLLFRYRHELNKKLEVKRLKESNALKLNRQKAESSTNQLYPNSSVDALSPYNRQRIAYLYCANGKKASAARTFCMGPYVLPRQFFLGKDTSLGTFLTNYCFNPEYKCKGCDRSMMLEHLRRIVHRNARIEIATHVIVKGSSSSTLEDLNTEDLPSCIPNTNCPSIICWRRCPICCSNSCIVPLPEAVFHLSFAKFIDYLANATYWISSFPGSSIDDDEVKECQHCTFHEHHHYFALQNYIATFKVIAIRPLHVIFSPMICRVKPNKVMCKDLIEMNYELNSMASEVFDRALSYFKPDPIPMDQPTMDSEENDASNQQQHLTPAAESLLAFVEQFKLTFRSHIGKFDPDGIFKRSEAIDSNDFYYIQADSCLTRCRYFLYSFISKWNSSKIDQSFGVETPTQLHHSKSVGTSLLGNTTKKEANTNTGSSSSSNLLHALVGSNSSLASLSPHHHSNGLVPPDSHHFVNSLMGATENSATSDGLVPPTISRTNSKSSGVVIMDLPLIANPLQKDLHFELPMNGATVLLRDFFDSKNNPSPDVGSIIAYALASSDYEEKKYSRAKEGTEGDTNFCDVFFGDSKIQCSIKVYFAVSFECLRSIIFGDGEEQFLRSLSKSSPWHPQGGKSGASFFRTEDERFVIKQMSRFELESFKKCGLKYIDYVNTASTEKRLTALCKIYGVFSINYVNKHNGNSLKIDVLVMEYLFYNKNIKQLWDLKGSLRNRYASTKTEAAVLLDENLVQDLWGNQLYVHPHSKIALNQAIVNDSHFLSNQGIMDYSLLAGICNESDEVVIGIVDYMRTFTLDKKVESLVKTALPIAHSPTVVSPEQYCKRFYEAIDGYFAKAPDQWTGQSDPSAN